ncbi:MAG: hypothetical protein LUQ31_08500 [Methanoregula sp.]|nr:hypothetical protein [Methanoregula sp.]
MNFPVRILAVALVLVVISAGCLTTKIPSVSKPEAPVILVDYHRTGGISGVDDRLVIFDNGNAVYAGKSSGAELVLNATDLELIKVLFNQSQYSQFESSYSAPRDYPDLMTYAITYHGKTVTVEDTAIPPRLQPTIDNLNRIISRAGSSSSQNSRGFVNLTR